jgi:hypothetical protein
VLGWSDSDGVRVAAYLVAAAVAGVSWWREHRRVGADRSLWPTFWLLTGAFFLFLALARAVDLGGLATELGRSAAGTTIGASTRRWAPPSSAASGSSRS